ncbi:hypothetical protein CGQ24_07330 [Arthrobacter sp. 7749]|nr:hypothetical protein CGQ24_07330 [Arthrobacter sp. 7749]
MGNSMPHLYPTVDDQPESQYVSVKATAAKWGMHVATVYRRIEDGTLTAHKIGTRAIRLDAAEVDAAFRR